MPFTSVKFRPGQTLSARVMNAIAEEVGRLGRLSVQAPLTLQDGAGGRAIGFAAAEQWMIKLTEAGTGGKYGWIRQQGVTGGTTIDHPGGESGTISDDPAVETNGYTGVPVTGSPVYPAWRDPMSGALLFTAGPC
ncbi:hypothetical protein V5E97_09580 [Singulisphaera sp. Ch08]|uniref:Uncharacterized protein n=1 Tax=Singulisphaera sp. Ch08 TaxID=3120278 RepID=A0AAU7CMD5_9BACT